MNNLIKQLEDDLINDVDVIKSLRKARIIAEEFELSDFVKWIDFELEGYPDGENLPEYRIFQGVVKVNDNQSLQISDLSVMENLKTVYVYDSIDAIKKISNYTKPILLVTLPPQIEKDYKKILGVDKIYRLCAIHQFENIISQVSQKLFKWVSKLKKSDKYCSDLKLSYEEKESKNPIININNSNVQMGSNNQIVYNKEYSEISNSINKLKSILENNQYADVLSKNQIQDINEKINNIELEIKKDEPGKSEIKKNTNFLRHIFESVKDKVDVNTVLSILNVILSNLDKIPRIK